jgi:hypothetical protein
MTTPSERVRAHRESAVCAGVLLLGVLGYLLLRPGAVRAVLVAATVLWLPGRCLVLRLGLDRAAGFWAGPLAVLLSVATQIVVSVALYAVHRHLAFGPQTLWTGLAALALIAWRRPVPEDAEPAPESGPGLGRAAQWRPARPFAVGALFLLGGAASAGVLALAYHLLPAQRQPGYLAFAYAPGFAAVPGVLEVTAGQRLTVPFTVTASQQDTDGLTVVAALDGVPVAGPARVAVTRTGPAPRAADGSTDEHDAVGAARLAVTVPAGCLHRFRFALERDGATLRTLDLYVSTDHLASACAT